MDGHNYMDGHVSFNDGLFSATTFISLTSLNCTESVQICTNLSGSKSKSYGTLRHVLTVNTVLLCWFRFFPRKMFILCQISFIIGLVCS